MLLRLPSARRLRWKERLWTLKARASHCGRSGLGYGRLTESSSLSQLNTTIYEPKARIGNSKHSRRAHFATTRPFDSLESVTDITQTHASQNLRLRYLSINGIKPVQGIQAPRDTWVISIPSGSGCVSICRDPRDGQQISGALTRVARTWIAALRWTNQIGVTYRCTP